jgi:hypothetical protein
VSFGGTGFCVVVDAPNGNILFPNHFSWQDHMQNACVLYPEQSKVSIAKPLNGFRIE